jgi:hypothetical protein
VDVEASMTADGEAYRHEAAFVARYDDKVVGARSFQHEHERDLS